MAPPGSTSNPNGSSGLSWQMLIAGISATREVKIHPGEPNAPSGWFLKTQGAGMTQGR